MDEGTWEQFATDAPELAERVRAKFAAAKHHVLATLAGDGSPRVHGVEVQFHGADVIVGMMFGSIKAKQLQRDGRFALHANPGDDMGVGDAKVIGIAVEVTDPDALQRYVDEVHPPPPFHMFRLLIDEVVLTFLHPDGDRLVLNVWRPGRDVTVIERI
jgi:hypothetical protein